MHSDKYIQCASLMKDANIANQVCSHLAEKINNVIQTKIDYIVSPAMGGLLVGYELSRHLGVKNIFCERVNGQFELRRGFEINQGDNILVVEDVITTGKSSLETFDLIKSHGGNIIAEACLIDRRNAEIKRDLDCEVISLINLDIKCYEKENIPEELKLITAVKPGSRFIKK